MEQLIKSLSEHRGTEEAPLPSVGPDLQEAAEAWAIYSLRTHKDTLLSRSLAISEAIAQYVTELNHALTP